MKKADFRKGILWSNTILIWQNGRLCLTCISFSIARWGVFRGEIFLKV